MPRVREKRWSIETALLPPLLQSVKPKVHSVARGSLYDPVFVFTEKEAVLHKTRGGARDGAYIRPVIAIAFLQGGLGSPTATRSAFVFANGMKVPFCPHVSGNPAPSLRTDQPVCVPNDATR